MDQNQNDNLFDNTNPPQSSEPTQIGGGARIYQTPPSSVPNEPVYTPPPTQPDYSSPVQPAAPKSNTNRWILIAVGGGLFLCCCCLVVAAVAMWPAIMEVWNSL